MPTDPRADWETLCRVMDRPELIDDPRYDTPQKRTACLDELEAHIQNWVLDLPDADRVVAALHAGGLPGARVATLGEALDSEQTLARGMTPEIPDRSGRRVRMLNSPYRFSTRPGRGVPAFREIMRSFSASYQLMGERSVRGRRNPLTHPAACDAD
jgi:crotonobetainyl-CoA:carnitine CoA-transferase CaiB-like acyl-CoA transferase